MSYFSQQYAKMVNIDPSNPVSVSNYYNSCLSYYSRELLPFLSGPKDQRILDAGCGIGGALHFLKTNGYSNIEGVNNSVSQLKVLWSNLDINAYHCELIEFLELKCNIYDTIILYDVIEHIPKNQVASLIKLLVNALNINGKLIIRTPNMGYFFSSYNRYNDFTHEYGYTGTSLMYICSQEKLDYLTLHSSYIGKKRKTTIRVLYTMFAKLFNNPVPEIFTDNIIITGVKTWMS